jgi:hypothetical protein
LKHDAVKDADVERVDDRTKETSTHVVLSYWNFSRKSDAAAAYNELVVRAYKASSKMPLC